MPKKDPIHTCSPLCDNGHEYVHYGLRAVGPKDIMDSNASKEVIFEHKHKITNKETILKHNLLLQNVKACHVGVSITKGLMKTQVYSIYRIHFKT